MASNVESDSMSWRHNSLQLGSTLYTTSHSLQWRHNEWDGILNHLRLDCLLNRLFTHRSKKTLKLRVTGLCGGIHRWPVDSQRPVTRKMFLSDVFIMLLGWALVGLLCRQWLSHHSWWRNLRDFPPRCNHDILFRAAGGTREQRQSLQHTGCQSQYIPILHLLSRCRSP